MNPVPLFQKASDKIYNSYTSTKKIGGAIGVALLMPMVSVVVIVRLKLFKIGLKKEFKTLLAALPTMEEREQVETELKWMRIKLLTEDKVLPFLRKLKTIAHNSPPVLRMVRSLEDLLLLCNENINKITSIVYPFDPQINSPEFFENLKSKYKDLQHCDWDDKSFDIYDQKY